MTSLMRTAACAVLSAAVLLLSACTGPPAAGDATVEDLGRPLSTADTEANPISRDAGLSAAWSDSESLWLFGDTSQRNGPAFLPGTTAVLTAYTSGVVPTEMREVPTPPAPHLAGLTSPQPFLPTPRGLRIDEQRSCDGVSPYPAAWPTGLARIPGTRSMLIVYAEVCVKSETDLPAQRLTLAVYDPATNVFTRTDTPFAALSLPIAQRLGSPVFGADGLLYLFTHDVETGRIMLARTGGDPQAWADPRSYRWWDRGWTADWERAASIVTVPFVNSLHVADYPGRGLGMIVQTEFGSGRFQIFTAGAPVGPWRPGPAGRVPGECGGSGYGCRAFNGHAELSTRDRFVLSWYSPGDLGGFGHVRLGEVAW
ncbi:hypothetical protein AB0M02_39040 [Actinoplanes sp. NPDC051861]|uniref:hypothetical protein n=1 Tax=Actinoplanes sp. NPDC051861 TaxID=3155170 RepID=UPI0034252383